jgi:hypothetical protein
MALWEIQYEDGTWAGSRNSGDTAEQAVAEWNADRAAIMRGIEFHDELPLKGEVTNVRPGKSSYRKLTLCDFRPNIRPAARAVRMREVWMDCGYARVPA